MTKQILVTLAWLSLCLTHYTTGYASDTGNWSSLNGEQIKTALIDQRVRYPDEGGAIQKFHTDGSTVYIDNGPSFGSWRTSDTQYCSVWPPASSWVCYDVRLSEDQLSVRFIGESGRIYEGFFEP